MGVLWVGANPGVRLYQGDELIGRAALCRIDWSVRGAGEMLLAGFGGRTRVLGTNLPLAEWVVETFLRPMDAVAMLGANEWGSVTYEEAEVVATIDVATGMRAQAGDVEFTMSGPLDRQLIYRERYVLDPHTYRVSFVNVPCAEGSITIGGASLPGAPRRWHDDAGRLRSTAQLAVAEVWSD